jgi:hypothetical protein
MTEHRYLVVDLQEHVIVVKNSNGDIMKDTVTGKYAVEYAASSPCGLILEAVSKMIVSERVRQEPVES